MTLSMKIQLCQWNENFSSAPKIYLALAPRVPLLLSTFFTQKHRKIIKFTDIRDNLYFFFFKFKKKILPSTSVGIWLGVLKFYAATYILKRKKMFILKIQRFDRLDFVWVCLSLFEFVWVWPHISRLWITMGFNGTAFYSPLLPQWEVTIWPGSIDEFHGQRLDYGTLIVDKKFVKI